MKIREGTERSTRTIIRVALNKKDIKIEHGERVELRTLQVDGTEERSNRVKTKSSEYQNFFAINCKILMHNKLIVKFPIDKKDK